MFGLLILTTGKLSHTDKWYNGYPGSWMLVLIWHVCRPFMFWLGILLSLFKKFHLNKYCIEDPLLVCRRTKPKTKIERCCLSDLVPRIHMRGSAPSPLPKWPHVVHSGIRIACGWHCMAALRLRAHDVKVASLHLWISLMVKRFWVETATAKTRATTTSSAGVQNLQAHKLENNTYNKVRPTWVPII